MSGRTDAHGDDMVSNSDMAAMGTKTHCCTCWRYTDDMNRDNQLVVSAATIIVNATPAIEATDAYKAASDFLVRKFNAGASAGASAGPSATSSTSALDRFRL